MKQSKLILSWLYLLISIVSFFVIDIIVVINDFLALLNLAVVKSGNLTEQIFGKGIQQLINTLLTIPIDIIAIGGVLLLYIKSLIATGKYIKNEYKKTT